MARARGVHICDRKKCICIQNPYHNDDGSFTEMRIYKYHYEELKFFIECNEQNQHAIFYAWEVENYFKLL
jgi:hypothetical protein